MLMADIHYKAYNLKKISFDTIIVGSGASGFNAANRLFENGVKDIAIITEDINIGTSRNSGSDKQTYYKLAIQGSDNDSVDSMAKVYLDGLHMHGDIAKVESSESVRAFMNLVELGVDFPSNEYGEYIGYKTDHDPNRRGTSAGPYTSKQMTEKLQKRSESYGIEILNHHKLIKVFTKNNKFVGGLTLNKGQYYLIHSNNIIFATGGPANIYFNKVYPNGQKGANGIAFEAGVRGKNLTHFQYGLASVKPKWNVSGTYMQALPSIYSVDDKGEKYYFLEEYYSDFNLMLKNIFLKGYQWPFDVTKIDGSSMIDYLVYLEETDKKRKVYLDFRENPSNKSIDFDALDSEVKDYLISNKADLEKPIDRLLKMNKKAYDFYMDHKVDLKKEAIQISMCAQHNNGGLAINIDYMTNIENLYSVGESSACHGIYRPGGSALNSGQVGSKRAAERIASNKVLSQSHEFEKEATEFIESFNSLISEDSSNVNELISRLQKEMTDYAAAFREIEKMEDLVEYRRILFKNFFKKVKIKEYELLKAYELYEIVISQIVYLDSMIDYSKKIDAKIGGSIYYYKEIDFNKKGDFINEVQVSEFDNGYTNIYWEKIREIPSNDEPFEIQWNKHLNRNKEFK